MGPSFPVLLALLTLLALIALAWIRRQGRQRQHLPADGDYDQSGARGDQPPEWVAALKTLSAEVEQVCSELDARLAARCARLEELLEAAEARSAQLSELLSRAAVSAAESEACQAGHKRLAAAQTVDEQLCGLGEQVREVCRLADAGVAPVKIAQTLDLSLGEVQLALNLRDYVSIGRDQPTGSLAAQGACSEPVASELLGSEAGGVCSFFSDSGG